MDTFRIFSLQLLGDVWAEVLIDGLGDEGGERCEPSNEREENFEQGVESMFSVVQPEFTLQSLSVESNIPIRCIVDQIKESGYHRVKAIRCTLLAMQHTKEVDYFLPAISSLTNLSRL